LSKTQKHLDKLNENFTAMKSRTAELTSFTTLTKTSRANTQNSASLRYTHCES